LRLIFEARLGKESRWHTYVHFLQMVPADAVLMEHTKDQETVLNSTWHGSADLARLWYRRKYLNTFVDSQFASDLFGAPPNKDELGWTGSVISTRSFSQGAAPDLKLFLIPVLDLLQHESPRQVNCRNELKGPVKHSLAVRDVEAGSALSFSYSEYGNTLLVSQAGFLMKTNDIGPPRPTIDLHAVPLL